MAIAYVESFFEDTGGSLTSDWDPSTTIAPTGDDLVVLLFHFVGRAGYSSASATYDPGGAAETSMTLVTSGILSASITYGFAVYRLDDADIAKGVAKSFNLTTSPGTARQGAIVVVYSGVDQTTPLSSIGTTSQDSATTAISDNVSSSSGDLVVDSVFTQSTSLSSAGTGQTVRENSIITTVGSYAFISEEAGDTSVTMSHTLTANNRFLHWYASLNAATGGGGNVTITCDAASLTLSGQSAAINRDLVLTAENGSFSLSGQSASITRDLVIAAAQGSISLSGQTAAITVAANTSYNELLGYGDSSQADCQLHLELDEAGSTATDTSGNGYDGTHSANSSTGATTGGATWLANSRDYDGASDEYSRTVSQAAFNFAHTDAFSFGGWVAIDSSAGSAISKMDALSNFRGWDIYVDSSDQHVDVNLLNTVSTNGINVSTGTSKFTNGQFFHVFATYDGSQSASGVRVYIDGVNESLTTNQDDLSATLAGSGEFFTGGRYAGSSASTPMNGRVSDAMVFDRVLSVSDIAELIDGPEPTNTVAPVVSGTELEGETLSCTTGTWDSQGNGTITYSYQWTRSDDGTGTGEVDISGATSSTYDITSSDVDKYIRCRVRGTNDGGYSAPEDENSNFTGVIGENLTITADYGSFTLSGQDAAISRDIILTAENASLTLSGQDASISRDLLITCENGSFTLSGQDATFPVVLTVTADVGSFVLSGQDAAISRDLILTSEQGSFALTGQDASFTVSILFTCDQGSFVMTGQDAVLSRDLLIACDTASLTLSGQDAGIVRDLIYTSDQGSFTLSGQAAAINRGLTVVASNGSYTLTGQEIAFAFGGDVTIISEYGSFTLSGQAATMRFPGTASTRRFGVQFDDLNVIFLGV